MVDAAGAALGALFGEILRAVVEAGIRAVEFKSILNRIGETLNRINPMVEDIGMLNRVLDRPEQEKEMFMEQLREGLNLVRRCSKIRWWNCLRPFYAQRLLDFEESLRRFFQVVVQAQIMRDNRRIMADVNYVREKLDRTVNDSFPGCCGVPGVGEFLVGLDEPLRELKAMLLRPGDPVMVLSAPGGCGKTTLAKKLCRDKEIKGIYGENIFFVTVSKVADIKVIVSELIQHKGFSVPQFRTDEDSIYKLENMMDTIGPRPILLVLDDVWPESESIIDALMIQKPEYKILVTSRSVFPIFKSSTYQLKLLNHQDAVALFHHYAFSQGGISSIPNSLVEKIVKACRGFPLALRVVGCRLCGQPEVIWARLLKQWSEGKTIFDTNTDLLKILQTSIDALEEMTGVKDCYLDLGSFPEDQRIPIAALIDMWMELYDFDENGDDAFANLHVLGARNLVNLKSVRNDAIDIDRYHKDYFVLQHDLLRELAIHLSSQDPIEQRERLVIEIRGNKLPWWWTEQRRHPFGARLLSISTDAMFSGNWHNLQLPKVEVLVLNFHSRNFTLPQFMEKMDQLKALIITNHGFSSAELCNLPPHGSLSSVKRIRLEHISISSVNESILQLKNLQKISLVMCDIGNAFHNNPQVPHLLPNLTEIVMDYCNLAELPEWLCKISCLEKVNITNCHNLTALPPGLGKLKNLKLLRLHACTELSELPESIGCLRKLSFLDISDCISLSNLPKQLGELCSLRLLHMRGCQGLSELPATVKDLKQLKKVICDQETGHLWKHYKNCVADLEIEELKEDVNLDWLYHACP